MKKYIIIAILLSVTIISSAQSKSEKQVATAVQDLKKAMIEGDGEALTRLCSSSLSYGHSS
ncbi:MAG: nuclear transport factor 2 family protein, partial [Chitinophagaceae bacterium]